MTNYKKIKNIIFDLGDVLIDLDENKTIKGFGKKISAFYENSMNSNFVEIAHQFERGEITANKFRASVSEIFNINLSPDEFDFHWNAMIVGMPDNRLKMLKNLRENFQIYVLSNTNEIHYNFFTQQKYWQPELFKKVYFSHQLKMRKPEARIFKHVLSENKLIAKETFFVDDNKDNIDAAKKLGIIAELVDNNIEQIIENLQTKRANN